MKLIHWDILEKIKNIESESIDLILTDPPYKTISWWSKRTFWTWFSNSVLSKNDWKIFEHNNIKIEDYIWELYRVLKQWTHWYIMTNFLNLEYFMREIRRVWFDIHTVLIWDKWNKVLSWRYMKNVEYIIFIRKWKAKRINNIWSNHILQHKNPIWNKLHETEKPVELMKQMILNSSNEWDIVLDPFMWAWATWVACIETNRNFIWIELDEKYFEIAKNRINN